MTLRTSHQQQFTLTLGEEQVIVHVSAMRRKSMRLQLTKAGEIDLRIPLGVPKVQVLAFVNQHHEWLLKRRQEFAANASKLNNSILIHGRELPIHESALNEFMITDNVIWVPAGWGPEQISQAVDSWLRRRAKLEFSRMIECWWPLFSSYAVERPILRVKKMRTRWGSLSKLGYINLNIALMQLPEPLMELVVVHELCHLKHFDHGPGFKALMSQCLPDWRERESELNSLSRLL